MLTSNVVIWSPLLNFLVPFKLPPPPTEAGCNSFEFPLVVREQFFRRFMFLFVCWFEFKRFLMDTPINFN